MSDLPPGWELATLGELGDVNPRNFTVSPADRDFVSRVPMTAVETETGRMDASDAVLYRSLRAKSLTPFEENDVLFAKITPCMENGKIAIARNLIGGRGLGSTEFHVFRASSAILPGYVAHYLSQKSLREQAERHMTGAVGQRRVPRNYIEQLQLPVPPLSEQRRIVEALEDHLSRLDACVQYLNRSVQQLHNVVKRTLTEAVPIPCPDSWELTTVANAGRVDLGRQRHPDWHTGPNMRPYLRVANVFEDRIDTSDVKEMDFPDDVFERFRLLDGDILLNEGQSPEYLGRPAMYKGNPPEVAFTNSLLRFRTRDDVSPDWALLVFRRHMHAGRFVREVRITTNIAHLSATRFKSVEFPVPPDHVQQEIVAATTDRLTELERLRSSIEAAHRTAERLRRSLLADAFSGRLVPHEPSDEPASVLLEHIRATRAAAPRPKRARRSMKAKESAQ